MYQSASRILRDCQFSLVSFIILPHAVPRCLPRRQIPTCVPPPTRQPRTVNIPGARLEPSASEHCVRAQSADAFDACIPLSPPDSPRVPPSRKRRPPPRPFIPVHSRRKATTPQPARREIPPDARTPLINTRLPPRRPWISSRSSSLDRAQVS